MKIKRINHKQLHSFLQEAESFRLSEREAYRVKLEEAEGNKIGSTSDKVTIGFILIILSVGIPAFAPVAVLFMLLLFYNTKRSKLPVFNHQQYNAVLKNRLIKALRPDLTPRKKQSTFEQDLKNAQLLEGHLSLTNRFSGADSNFNSFEFANIKAYNSRHQISFDGFVIKVDSSLNFGKLFFHKKGDHSIKKATKGLEEVKLEKNDPIFDSKYTIYSKNSSEALLLLTQQFLFPLRKIYEISEQSVQWAYCENALFLMIPATSAFTQKRSINDSFEKDSDYIKDAEKWFNHVALLVQQLCKQEDEIRLELKKRIHTKRRKDAEALKKEKKKAPEPEILEQLEVDFYEHLIL